MELVLWDDRHGSNPVFNRVKETIQIVENFHKVIFFIFWPYGTCMK